MSDKFTHDPDTIKDDIVIFERLLGTVNQDTPDFYIAAENILRFTKWCILGTDGKLDHDT